jgi:hypothetical protein
MARLFNGTNDAIETSVAPVTTLPLTVSCWAKTSSSKVEVAYVIGDGARQLASLYTNNDLKAHAFNNDSTLSNDAASTGTFALNTWFHMVGTFATSQTISFLNGVQGTTATAAIASPTPNQESIGISVQRTGKWWVGSLAEIAVWSDILTLAEIKALAGGISPLLIRPSILKVYRPLWGLHSPEIDLSGNMNAGTLTGTAFAPHAPVKLFRNRAKTSNASSTVQSLSSLAISPASVVNGIGATGTVTLASPAAVGGVVVTLSSNNVAAVVPASVTVAAGARTATFAITTATVATSTLVTVTGISTTTQTATLTVTPAAAISALSVNPSTVTNGTSSTGTVTLNSPAGGGAPGTTWNVTAGTGDRTATLQSAINGASSGDSIVFAAGTYHVTNLTLKSGIAYVASGAAIIQSSNADASFGINGSDSHDITLDGLTFTGTGASPTSGAVDFSGGSGSLSCNHIIIKNCIFNNNGITSAWLKNSFIVNNDFNNIGDPGTGCYCYYADNCTLAGNVFTNCYQGFGGNFDGQFPNQGRNNLYAQNKGTGTNRIFMELIGNAQVAGSPETQNLIVQDNVATAWGAQPADGEQTAYSIVPDFGTGTIIRRNYGQGPNRGIGIEMSGVSAIADSNYIDNFGLGIIGYSSLDHITNNNIIHFSTQTSTYTQTNETVTGNTNNVSLTPPVWLGRWTGPVGANSTVALSSSDTHAVVPSSVIVLAGATTANFTITTTTVASAVAATITGTLGGTATAILTVNPTATLTAFSVSPPFVNSGSSSLGTLTLTSPAITGGKVVTLSSGNAAAVVPASVTIPAGALSATFLVTTTNVTVETAVTLTAVGGATKTAVLTVEPTGLTLSALSVSPTSVANGVSSTGTVTLSGVAPGAPGVPTWDHIVLVMEENHTFGEVVGDTVDAPYINNTLIAGGALLTNYFAITHPSEPNYLALYAGDTFGVVDDSAHSEADPSLYTVLNAVGKTFVGYVETSSPAKHNPWESFPEGFSVEQNFAGLFPATNFNALPDVAWVIPNQADDMHDGTIAQGDSWLQANIDGYAQWALTHNSLLVVTWDEDDSSASNKVPCILFGANVVPGLYSTTYNHYSLLRTICDAKGVTAPRNGATAVEFTTDTFGSGGSTAVPLTSNSPAAIVPGSALVAAGATTGTFPITTTVVSSSTVATISGTFGGVPRSATLTVTPTSVTLASLSIAPASVNNGVGSTGTLTLSGPALSGGATVTLSSNNGAATVPASALIAAGLTSVTFPIATTAVATSTTVTITGTFGGVPQTATITVVPAVAIASLTVSPSSVANGTPATGTVTLTAAAPSTGDPQIASPTAASITDPGGHVFTFHGGVGPGLDRDGVVTGGTGTILGLHNGIVYTLSPVRDWYYWSGAPAWTWFGPVSPLVTTGSPAVVTLTSNNAAATIPATVSVAPGATTATFPIATHSVALDTLVTLSGTFGSVVKTGSLTVTAAGALGGVSEYTITLPDGSVADVPPQLFIIDRSVASLALAPASVLGGVGSIGTVTLANPAPTGNIVVALASNNILATVPPTVTVVAGALTATFAILTFAVSTTTLISITATAPATAAQAVTLTLTPTLTIALTSLTVAPGTVVSGDGATGTVTLTNPAAVGGASVVLSSGDPSVTVPASVTIPSGSSSATFAITTIPIPVTKVVSITGNFGGTPQSANLTLTATVTLGSLSVTPTLVFGGANAIGKVTLTNPAEAGGETIALSSGDSHAVVPASVVVAEGALIATFPVTTTTILAATPITLTATFLGTARTAILTVTPIVALASLTLTPTTIISGDTATATVTLNSPAPAGGALVTLTCSDLGTVIPPAILIAEGALNASFTISPGVVVVSTIITFSGSYGGTTQTATLTLGPLPVASTVAATATLTAFEVPLKPTPQTLSLTMGGAIYNMTVRWNVAANSWVLDIADSLDAPLVSGIPLITGVDLLAQYGYLGIAGQLFVSTDHDPLAPPTFANLGTLGHLYFVPNP